MSVKPQSGELSPLKLPKASNGRQKPWPARKIGASEVVPINKPPVDTHEKNLELGLLEKLRLAAGDSPTTTTSSKGGRRMSSAELWPDLMPQAASPSATTGDSNRPPKHTHPLSLDFASSLPRFVRSFSRNSSYDDEEGGKEEAARRYSCTGAIPFGFAGGGRTGKTSFRQDRFRKFDDMSSKLVRAFMGGAADDHNIEGAGLLHGRHCSITKQLASSSAALDGVTTNLDPPMSPLRRMIEPLLKPKDGRHRRLISFNESPKSPKPSSSSPLPEGKLLALGSRKQAQSALVRISWKQEFPLIVFSAKGGDIVLAATTMEEGEEDVAAYTISLVRDAKKKSGAWSSNNGGSFKKSRGRQGFLSTSIAQMRVSDSVQREFVLLGNELEPASSIGESIVESSSFQNELAAILVEEDAMTAAGSQSSIVAVLPRSVHGSPDTDTPPPPPLIQRWQTGGSCDCGGWDEGCSLTIISDKNGERRSSSSSSALPSPCKGDGVYRIELFPKGRDRHAFSLAAVGEGLYDVEFEQSISSLQAFGICIAVLHGSNRGGSPLRQSGSEEVTDNPPPSPVSTARRLASAKEGEEEGEEDEEGFV